MRQRGSRAAPLGRRHAAVGVPPAMAAAAGPSGIACRCSALPGFWFYCAAWLLGSAAPPGVCAGSPGTAPNWLQRCCAAQMGIPVHRNKREGGVQAWATQRSPTATARTPYGASPGLPNSSTRHRERLGAATCGAGADGGSAQLPPPRAMLSQRVVRGLRQRPCAGPTCSIYAVLTDAPVCG